jgi:hypothetical protein
MHRLALSEQSAAEAALKRHQELVPSGCYNLGFNDASMSTASSSTRYFESVTDIISTCNTNISNHKQLLPPLKALSAFVVYKSQQATAISAGAVEMLLDVLRIHTHVGNAEVVQYACSCIGFLSHAEQSEDAIPLLLAAIEAFQVSQPVQTDAAKTIRPEPSSYNSSSMGALVEACGALGEVARHF